MGGRRGRPLIHLFLLVVSRIEGAGFVKDFVAQRAGAVHEAAGRVIDKANIGADDWIAPGRIGDDYRDIRIAVERVNRYIGQIGSAIGAVVDTGVDQVGPVVAVQVARALVSVLNRVKLDLGTDRVELGSQRSPLGIFARIGKARDDDGRQD